VPGRKILLDTNCFIGAGASDTAAAAFDAFTARAAPRLYLSAVVAAELRAGSTRPAERRRLEGDVFQPYERRGRIVTPSEAAWRGLGETLATLVRTEGLELRTVKRSFIFDILIAWSCREVGALLVSANLRDLERIARVCRFDFAAPYPDPATI
jgi:predicted nucleic acid-binding protein